MNDYENLCTHYQSKGYKFVGSVNFDTKAVEAYQKSKNKQEHKIGCCEYLIACHDLKVFMLMDSGD